VTRWSSIRLKTQPLAKYHFELFHYPLYFNFKCSIQILDIIGYQFDHTESNENIPVQKLQLAHMGSISLWRHNARKSVGGTASIECRAWLLWGFQIGWANISCMSFSMFQSNSD
jgi:hypothetical protein